jgi:hypothetical protein
MRKILLLSLSLLPALAQAELYITIVQGLGGMPQYQAEFDAMREKVVAASVSMTAEDKVFTFTGDAATREALLAHFGQLAARMGDDDRAAIYLLGHGSFDGEEHKFNIPGPDLTGSELKSILESLPGRNHFLVNTSSTSGAMVETIAGKEETPAFLLIAATRNGNERNATHFGRFFAEALTTSEADLNKNDNISVQEAFEYAERGVAAYFEEEQRLATEHPQLRGDGAAQFSLARLNALELAADDPELNQLLQQRLALEAQIEDLQLRRNEFDNAAYLQRLQALILQSAELSERIEEAQQGADGGNE